MKTKLLLLLTFLSFSLGWGQISITGTGSGNTYSENFSTLAQSGTSNTTLPAGWAFLETLTNANTSYSGGTGSGTGADTYSFGLATSSERSFGGLRSGNLATVVGVAFTNNTGATITDLVITYKGETWRVGAANRIDKLDFQYSVNATSLSTGTWTDFDTLDYANPGQATGSGAQQHTANLSGTISSLSIANGTTFRLRWNDFDSAGADDGMAVDDFTIYVIGGGASPAEINLKGNSVSIVDGDTTPTTADHTDFGTLATSTNMARTYTIENIGGTVLNISSIAMASGTDFVVSGAPSSVAAGSSATFTVTFNSAVGGTFTNTVNVISDDTDEATYNFDVKAIAQAPTPNIAVKGNNNVIAVGDTTPSTTDHTDFGSTAVSTNITRTYTIENTGTGTLTINNILMLNAPTSKYSIGGISFPTNIAPAGSTTFTVTFNSAAAGTFADNVLIDNNDPTDSTYDFAVTGTAVALNFAVGDISILGMATDTPDSFSFVNWIPIPVDAELFFTDNSYDGTALATTENTLKWKNNSGSIIATGTVIVINSTTPTADLGSVISGNLNGLTSPNETIFIYEGSAANPNFIYGISKAAWLTTGSSTTALSYLPTSLNVTNGNIVLGTSDNYEYNNSRDNQESMADYKTMVNTPANYKSSNTYFALSSEDFKLAVVWETAAWSNTTGPTSSLSAIMKDVYNTTTNGAIVAKDLTVKTGGSVTVEATNPVTIHGNIINNLTETAFVVNNGGSILQPNSTATNNNTGNITYKRTTSTLSNNLDIVFWGSPVANQTLSGMWMTTANDTFYSFDTAKSGGEDWAYAAPSTIMEAGKGYATRAVSGTGSPVWTPSNSWTANFVGKPNNGDVPFTMVNAGGANIDNLMANPYPSAIDLDFFRNDVDNSDNLTGNFYFWTHSTQYNGTVYTNSDYAIININLGSGISTSGATPAPDKYVDAGQGFFAETATAGTVLFKNAHRVAGNNNAFYRQASNTNVVNSDKIWLNLSNANGLFKQQLLAYTANATVDFDPNYDAKSFEGNADIDFYSIIPNKNLAIQSRPTFTDNDVVPIGYKLSISGNFSIAIDHSDGLFAAGQTVYLQDNLLGIDFNLLQGAYNFTTNSGTFNNRFVLKYTSALSTTDDNLSANNVIVASDKKTLKIKSVMENIQSVTIYDVIGRKIYSQNAINTKEFSKTNVVQNTQTLIVKITLENGVIVSKKIVHKN